MMLVLSACGDSESGSGDDLAVVATTTILGDMVRTIAGDEATIEVLLPIGADPHDYQASARQAAAVVEADLVIANGLGLEEGLEDVLESAVADGANVLEVGELVDAIPFRESGDHEGDDEGDDHEEGEDHDDDHGDLDPHVWLDPVRMADAAMAIGAELAALAPDGPWMERAEEYAAELRALDLEIREVLEVIPEESRKLVTNHEALGYFAERYDFDVIGTVIPGGATLADPSAAELVALVDEIREEGVGAIFAETTEPATLAEALAAELGGVVEVVELYTGSLGEPGSGADTLIGLLRTNADRIAEALR